MSDLVQCEDYIEYKGGYMVVLRCPDCGTPWCSPLTHDDASHFDQETNIWFAQIIAAIDDLANPDSILYTPRIDDGDSTSQATPPSTQPWGQAEPIASAIPGTGTANGGHE